jgi:hypothetical protein
MQHLALSTAPGDDDGLAQQLSSGAVCMAPVGHQTGMCLGLLRELVQFKAPAAALSADPVSIAVFVVV